VNPRPLAGRRVLVTRSAHQAAKLSEGLRQAGAEPVEVPVLEIGPPSSFDPLDAALRRFPQFDWLILTSSNAIRSIQERAAALGVHLVQPPSMKIAAVGEATAEAAHKAGFGVTFVPASYVAESLIKGLVGRTAGQRILLARAAIARDIIPDMLRAAGAMVDVVEAYRNVMPEKAPEQLRQALAGKIHAATFTSSSSVTHLAEAAHKAGIDFPFAGIPAISIGPITSQTLRESGWPPAAEADPSDIPGLVAAVVKTLSSEDLDIN
jgi:uroporphyrinogen-III synthase/uroporphyrinogen III methyltransferase/synthase